MANGWRSGTIGPFNKEAKKYPTPGHRSYHERKKFEGHCYRNIAAAEGGEAFDLAYTNCQSRCSGTNYWEKFAYRWQEWAAWQSWQDSTWYHDCLGWGSGGWSERPGCFRQVGVADDVNPLKNGGAQAPAEYRLSR